MKIFTHFSKNVILLYLENDFIEYLKQEVINYRILPIMLGYPFVPRDYVVTFMCSDGSEYYALVTHEYDGKRVLITEQVPEDGWLNLSADIHYQERGEIPDVPNSLTYTVLERAFDAIRNERKEKLGISIPPGDEAEFSDEDFKAVRKILAEHGITAANISDVGIWDVENELIERIYKA